MGTTSSAAATAPYFINWNTSFTDVQEYITCYDFPVCEIPSYGVSIFGDNQTPPCADHAALFYPCTCNAWYQGPAYPWSGAVMYKSIVYCNGVFNIFEIATLSSSLLLFLAACSVAILLLRGARYSVTRIPFWIATLEFEPQSWFESLIGPLYLLVFALICSCGMFFVFFMANGLNLFYHQAAHDPLSKPGNLVKRLQSAIIQGNATYAISSKNIDFTPLTNTSGGVFLRKYRGTAGTPLFGNGTFADYLGCRRCWASLWLVALVPAGSFLMLFGFLRWQAMGWGADRPVIMSLVCGFILMMSSYNNWFLEYQTDAGLNDDADDPPSLYFWITTNACSIIIYTYIRSSSLVTGAAFEGLFIDTAKMIKTYALRHRTATLGAASKSVLNVRYSGLDDVDGVFDTAKKRSKGLQFYRRSPPGVINEKKTIPGNGKKPDWISSTLNRFYIKRLPSQEPSDLDEAKKANTDVRALWTFCRKENIGDLHTTKEVRYFVSYGGTETNPPSSGWVQSMSETDSAISFGRFPDNYEKTHNGSIVVETLDETIHELEAEAKQKVSDQHWWNRLFLSLCVLNFLSSGYALGWETYPDCSPYGKFVAVILGFELFALLLATEVCSGFSPGRIAIVVVINRCFILFVNKNYYFVGLSLVYLVFATILTVEIVDVNRPLKTARQIIHDELTSLMPKWVFSRGVGAAGGAAVGEGEKRLSPVEIVRQRVILPLVEWFMDEENRLSPLTIAMSVLGFVERTLTCVGLGCLIYFRKEEILNRDLIMYYITMFLAVPAYLALAMLTGTYFFLMATMFQTGVTSTCSHKRSYTWPKWPEAYAQNLSATPKEYADFVNASAPYNATRGKFNMITTFACVQNDPLYMSPTQIAMTCIIIALMIFFVYFFERSYRFHGHKVNAIPGERVRDELVYILAVPFLWGLSLQYDFNDPIPNTSAFGLGLLPIPKHRDGIWVELSNFVTYGVMIYVCGTMAFYNLQATDYMGGTLACGEELASGWDLFRKYFYNFLYYGAYQALALSLSFVSLRKCNCTNEELWFIYLNISFFVHIAIALVIYHNTRRAPWLVLFGALAYLVGILVDYWIWSHQMYGQITFQGELVGQLSILSIPIFIILISTIYEWRADSRSLAMTQIDYDEGWVLELPASLGGDPRTNSSVFYTLLITEAFALVWIVGITISIYIAEQSDRDENAEQLIVLAINAFAHAIGLGSESFATKAIWFLSLISAGYVMQLVAVSIIMYWASHRFQLPEWLTRIEFYRLDLIEGCCSLYIPAFSVATATIGLVVVYLYEHLIVQYSNYVFTVEYVLCLATLICWGYAATLEGRQEQDYGPYIFPVFTFEGREQRLVDQNLACMLFYVGAMFVFFNVVYISMVLVSIYTALFIFFLLSVVVVSFTLDKVYISGLDFARAWAELRLLPETIEQFSVKTLESENKDGEIVPDLDVEKCIKCNSRVPKPITLINLLLRIGWKGEQGDVADQAFDAVEEVAEEVVSLPFRLCSCILSSALGQCPSRSSVLNCTCLDEFKDAAETDDVILVTGARVESANGVYFYDSEIRRKVEEVGQDTWDILSNAGADVEKNMKFYKIGDPSYTIDFDIVDPIGQLEKGRATSDHNLYWTIKHNGIPLYAAQLKFDADCDQLEIEFPTEEAIQKRYRDANRTKVEGGEKHIPLPYAVWARIGSPMDESGGDAGADDHDGVENIRMLDAEFERWDKVIGTASTILKSDENLYLRYIEETRLEAAFQMFAVKAWKQQRMTEESILWDFSKSFLWESGKGEPAQKGDGGGAQNNANAGSADKKRPMRSNSYGGAKKRYSISEVNLVANPTDLGSHTEFEMKSPAELQRWAQRHKSDLRKVAAKFAEDELIRRRTIAAKKIEALRTSEARKGVLGRRIMANFRDTKVEKSLQALDIQPTVAALTGLSKDAAAAAQREADDRNARKEKVYVESVRNHIVAARKRGTKWEDPLTPRVTSNFEGATKNVALASCNPPYRMAERDVPPACPEKGSSVSQGGLEDCWLLSAVNVLPSIKHLFLEGGKDGDDFHVVRFYKADTGKWEAVVVDERLPVLKDNGGANSPIVPVYAHALPKKGLSSQAGPVNDGRVLILEKAYAKWMSSRRPFTLSGADSAWGNYFDANKVETRVRIERKLKKKNRDHIPDKAKVDKAVRKDLAKKWQAASEEEKREYEPKYNLGKIDLNNRPPTYDYIQHGLVHDGLQALTGGATEEISLTGTAEAAADVASGRTWSRLQKYSEEGHLLGCGSAPIKDPTSSTKTTVDASGNYDDVPWDDCGIVNGHAYAITKVREFTMSSEDGSSVTFRMLLLKNPWAFNPWDLPGVNVRFLDWGPLSSLWSKPGGTYMAQQLYGADAAKFLKYNATAGKGQAADDWSSGGEFWIRYEDFLQHFITVFVCRLLDGSVKLRRYDGGSDNEIEKQWHKASIEGSWSGDCCGGNVCGPQGHCNPQYRLQLDTVSTVFITVTQTPMMGEGSKPGADEFHFQMFMLVRQDTGISELEMRLDKPLNVSELPADSVWYSGPLKDQREVSLEITLLASGSYLLIPFTSQAGCMASFTVRAWAKDSPIALFDLDEDEIRARRRMNRSFVDAYGDLVEREEVEGGRRENTSERTRQGAPSGDNHRRTRGQAGRNAADGPVTESKGSSESNETPKNGIRATTVPRKSRTAAPPAAAAAAAAAATVSSTTSDSKGITTGKEKGEEKGTNRRPPGALTFTTHKVAGKSSGAGKDEEAETDGEEASKRNSAVAVSTGPSELPTRSPRNSRRVVRNPSIKAKLPGPPPPAAPEM